MTDGIIERINELFNSRKARKTFLKLRFPLILAVFILILPLLDKTWFLPGLAVSVLGEMLQLWCFATIKTKKRLTTQGPYMFVRNPMYLGRFLLVFGVLMMTGNLLILLACVIVYYFYMTNRVKREEKLLSELFGHEYKEYCSRVRPYIPTINSYFDSGGLFRFDAESFAQNHGMRNMLLVGVCYAVLYIFTFVKPL